MAAKRKGRTISGIWVPVELDTTRISQNLKNVHEQIGTVITQLQSAFKVTADSGKISNFFDTTKLVRGVVEATKAVGSLRDGIEALRIIRTGGVQNALADITSELNDMGKAAGLSENAMTNLIGKISQTQAVQSQVDALNKLGKTAGLTNQELYNLAKQLGTSTDATQKLSGYAGSVDELSDAVKNSSSNLEFYKQRLTEVNAVSADVSKLDTWVKRLDLADDAVAMLAKDLGVSEAAVAKFRNTTVTVSDATEQLRIKVQTLATTVGVAETNFSDLYEKASKVQSINQQADAFNTLGTAVGMSSTELLTFAKNLGATPDVVHKIKGYAGSVDELSDAVKNSSSNLEFYKQRLTEVNAVSADVSKLQKWSQKLNLNQKEVRQLATDLGIAEKSLLAFEAAEKKAATSGRGLKGIFTPGSMSSGVQSAVSAFGVSLGMYGLAELGKASFQAELRLDSIKTAFEAITGSATESNIVLAQIRETSNRLGLSFYDTAESAKQLFAAAQNSELKDNAMEIFEAFSSAGVSLKLTGDQMNSVFLALSQMISKGKVSAEELRLQLAERFPGAVSLFAQSIGKTTKELDAMLQKGEVGLDSLVKFAARVQEEYGDKAVAASKSLQSELNRLTTSWDALKASFVDTKLASSAVIGIRESIDGIGSAMEFVGQYSEELKASAIAVGLFATSYLLLGKNIVQANSLITASEIAIVSFTGGIAKATAAIKAFGVFLMANPVIAWIAVLSSAVAGLVYYKDTTDEVVIAQKALDEANKEVTKSFENFSSKTKDNSDALHLYIRSLEKAQKAQDDLNKTTDKSFEAKYVVDFGTSGDTRNSVLGLSTGELSKKAQDTASGVQNLFNELKKMNEEVLDTRNFSSYLLQLDKFKEKAQNTGLYTKQLQRIIEDLQRAAKNKIELGLDQRKLTEQLTAAKQSLDDLSAPRSVEIKIQLLSEQAKRELANITSDFEKASPEGKIQAETRKLEGYKEALDQINKGITPKAGLPISYEDEKKAVQELTSLISQSKVELTKLEDQTSSGFVKKRLEEDKSALEAELLLRKELTGSISTYDVALAKAEKSRVERESKLRAELDRKVLSAEEYNSLLKSGLETSEKAYENEVEQARIAKRRSDQSKADAAANKQATEAKQIAEAYRDFNNELREAKEGNEALRSEISGVTDETAKLELKERAVATWRKQEEQKILTQIDDWKSKKIDANKLVEMQTALTDKVDLEAKKKILDIEKERASLDEKNATLRMDFENEYANMVGVTSEGLKKSIQDRYNNWYKAGVDIVRLEEWKNDQILRSNRDAMSGIIVAYKDYASTATNQAKQFGEIWSSFSTGVDNAFSTAFEDLLFGGENAAEQLKSLFKKTLAQMIYTAAVQPIVVQMVGTLTSGITSIFGGGSAVAGVGGNIGSNISNVTSVLPNSWTTGITDTINDTMAGWFPNTFASSGTVSALSAGAANAGVMSATGGAADIAGLKAAEAASTLSNTSTFMGTVTPYLGAASLGSMGYSLLGNAVGLPQSKYSGLTAGLGAAAGWGLGGMAAGSAALAGTGMAAGATFGSVVPVVGTIIGALAGGLLGSLFGAERKTHPSVYGHMEDLGYTTNTQSYIDAFMNQATYDRAGSEEASAYAQVIGEAASQTAGSILDLAALLPDEYKKSVEDQLESATWSAGRGVSGATWNFQNWEEGMAEERVQEAITDMFSQMGQTAQQIFLNAFASSDMQSPFDSFDLSTEAGFTKASMGLQSINAITTATAEIKNPTTEMEQQAAAFVEQMNAMAESVKSYGVNAAYADNLISEYRTAYVDSYVESLEEMFNPLSDIETQAKNYKAAIDGYASALTTMGASEAQLAQVRGYTQNAIDSITGSLDAAFFPLSDVETQTKATMESLTAYGNALTRLGATADELAKVDEARAKVQADLLAQVNAYVDAVPDVVSSTQDTMTALLGLKASMVEAGNSAADLSRIDAAWGKMQSDLLAQAHAYVNATPEIISQANAMNAEFDALRQAMIEAGNATADLTALEQDRVQAVAAMQAEYVRSFDQGLAQRYATLNGTSDAVSRAISQENELREAVEKFGEGSAQVSQLLHMQAAENVAAAQANVDALQSQLNQLKQQAIQAEISAINEQLSAAKTLKDTWERLSTSLYDSRAKLWTSDADALGLFARRDAAQSEFDRLYQLTMSGDADATAELASSGDTLLSLLKETSANGAEYTGGFWNVEQKLKDAESVAGKQLSAAQKSYDALTAQLKAQQTMLDALGYNNNSLDAINAQIVSVGQQLATALGNLKIAQSTPNSSGSSSGSSSGNSYVSWEDKLLSEKTTALNSGQTLAPGQTAGGWTDASVKAEMIKQYGSIGNWYANAGKLEGFATGGITPANMPFWVGEEGPELVVSPQQLGVVNNRSSMNLVQNGQDNSEQVKLLEEQNELLRQLLVESKRTVSNTNKTQDALETQNRMGIKIA